MPRMDDMIKIKIVKKSPEIRRAETPRETREIRQVPPPPERYVKPNRVRKGPRYLLWFVALLCVIFFFFSLSFMFSQAEVSITPKTADIVLDQSFTASKDPTAPMPFDLVVIAGEETKKVSSKEKETVEVPARGTVILYNAFSSNSQLLTVDTRLEGSNGKIYKTEKRIVIPGMSKGGEPGKVEVGIYGASGGEEYNSAPLDFKIFGFKGTPKYAKFYARSKGDITGGIKGDFYAISGVEKEKVLRDLKASLQSKLLKKATEQIPSGFVLFEDAVFLSTGDGESASFSKESSVPVTLKGTLYGFLLEEKKLTKKIVENAIEKYDGSDVYIHNLKDFSFELIGKENVVFSDVKNIEFTLKGDSKVVWRFNTDKFLSELYGKDKKDFNVILSKYPNTVSANLVLKPFWRMSLPEKEKDIDVEVNYPK